MSFNIIRAKRENNKILYHNNLLKTYDTFHNSLKQIHELDYSKYEDELLYFSLAIFWIILKKHDTRNIVGPFYRWNLFNSISRDVSCSIYPYSRDKYELFYYRIEQYSDASKEMFNHGAELETRLDAFLSLIDYAQTLNWLSVDSNAIDFCAEKFREAITKCIDKIDKLQSAL